MWCRLSPPVSRATVAAVSRVVAQPSSSSSVALLSSSTSSASVGRVVCSAEGGAAAVAACGEDASPTLAPSAAAAKPQGVGAHSYGTASAIMSSSSLGSSSNRARSSGRPHAMGNSTSSSRCSLSSRDTMGGSFGNSSRGLSTTRIRKKKQRPAKQKVAPIPRNEKISSLAEARALLHGEVEWYRDPIPPKELIVAEGLTREQAEQQLLVAQILLLLGRRRQWREVGAFFAEGKAHLEGHAQGPIPLNDGIYAAAIWGYGRSKKWVKVKELLQEMADKGIQRTQRTFNIALRSYSICENGRIAEVRQLLLDMRKEGVRPSASGYTAAIKAASKAAEYSYCLKLLALMEAHGLEPTKDNYYDVINACEKAGKHEQGLKLVALMEERDTYITASPDEQAEREAALAKEAAFLGEDYEPAVALLEELHRTKSEINLHTYFAAIRAVSRKRAQERAWYLQAVDYLVEMREREHEPDLTCFNDTLMACARGGLSHEALSVLDMMAEDELAPDTKSFTSAIEACARNGEDARAQELLARMKTAGLQPANQSFNAVIKASGSSTSSGSEASLDAVMGILGQMREANLKPDGATYSAAMLVCAKAGQKEIVKDLVNQVKESNMFLEEPAYAAGLALCEKEGYAKEATILADMRRIAMAEKESARQQFLAANAQGREGTEEQEPEVILEAEEERDDLDALDDLSSVGWETEASRQLKEERELQRLQEAEQAAEKEQKEREAEEEKAREAEEKEGATEEKETEEMEAQEGEKKAQSGEEESGGAATASDGGAAAVEKGKEGGEGGDQRGEEK